ncbi:hypothetical protein [Fundidesulfovibrio magnetotacticus]|uniref:hypothetical protein n=1 Tax=Fundidesulfovibrio magnetotacticus TaxID=2730080 RepID=UPI0015664A20|nr:hypothetical protein [Fundidesulfovibrio magnetotacticus]
MFNKLLDGVEREFKKDKALFLFEAFQICLLVIWILWNLIFLPSRCMRANPDNPTESGAEQTGRAIAQDQSPLANGMIDAVQPSSKGLGRCPIPR